MDLIIESLKRLFESEQIDIDTLTILVNKGTITETDKKYIIDKDGE